MKNTLSIAVFAGLLFSAAAAHAGESCPENFANGDAPIVTNTAMTARTTQLCFRGYALLHSGISRTPLWSAEHLTQARLEQGRGLKRKNSFHVETRLPEVDRSLLSDYQQSCFDRGHNVPSGDSYNSESQFDTFSLANMVPQNPAHNEELWEGIERSTKILAEQRGSLYVITGPVFAGATVERLNGRVMVPTFMYKAIYDPATGEAGAYLSPNSAEFSVEVVSIAQLEKKIGINLFPHMSTQIKNTAMTLPNRAKAHFKARTPRAGCEASSSAESALNGSGNATSTDAQANEDKPTHYQPGASKMAKALLHFIH